MAPQNSALDPQQIIEEAAKAIVAGQPLTPQQMQFAAGWSTKLAVDSNNEPLLEALILLAAGRPKAAMSRLVAMLPDDGSSAAASSSPLDDLLRTPPTATQPPADPNPTAATPAADPTQQTPKPGPATQRPAGFQRAPRR